MATTASRTSAAASARGMCGSRSRTTGIATTATMSAATIGPTIVYVSASSQIRPEEQQQQPDEQPGAPAQVAQPARRGERLPQVRASGPRRVVAFGSVHFERSLAGRPVGFLIPAG